MCREKVASLRRTPFVSASSILKVKNRRRNVNAVDLSDMSRIKAQGQPRSARGHMTNSGSHDVNDQRSAFTPVSFSANTANAGRSNASLIHHLAAGTVVMTTTLAATPQRLQRHLLVAPPTRRPSSQDRRAAPPAGGRRQPSGFST